MSNAYRVGRVQLKQGSWWSWVSKFLRLTTVAGPAVPPLRPLVLVCTLALLLCSHGWMQLQPRKKSRGGGSAGKRVEARAALQLYITVMHEHENSRPAFAALR